MMTNYDISDIESAFMSIVKTAGVSSNVYPNRPKSVTKSQDFVVVRLGTAVEDLAAYGTCRVRIFLFARDVENIKNSTKLGMMYDALVGNMPAQSGRYMIDVNPTISPDVADDYGFHARIITFKVTIKVQ